MTFANIPGAEHRAIMRRRARIAPKYSVEITLYDFDGVFQTEVIWDPHLPSPSKLRKLASKIDAVLEPFHTKVFEIAGPLEGEAS